MSHEEAVRALALQLRGMRWGIENYRTGVRSSAPEAQERLTVLLGRYDLALMQMAVLLGVASGSSAFTVTKQQLRDEFRSLLKDDIGDAGVDRTPPPA